MENHALSQLDGLTARELQVLRLLAVGLVPREIAQRLGITHKTARNHAANVYDKLNIHSRAQAVRYAVSVGLAE